MESSASRRDGEGTRAAGWWGLAFVVLLLVSAGMATTPGRATPDAAARTFYQDHRGVVLTAQLVGLLAAASFVPFVLALAPRGDQGRRVVRTGCGVAAAAALASVPIIWLCVAGPGASGRALRGLLTASDLVDVVLFTAIAAFALATAGAARARAVQGAAALVAVLAAARAVLLVAGGALLELAAPLAFVALVTLLSVAALARRPLLGSRPRGR